MAINKRIASEEFVNEKIANLVDGISGTVEITDGDPVKSGTVLTVNPEANEVKIYTADEVDSMRTKLTQQIQKLSQQIGSGVGGATGNGAKTLIGEITLNNTNTTPDTSVNKCIFGDDLKAKMTNIFATLDKGYGVLVAEMVSEGAVVFDSWCSYTPLEGSAAIAFLLPLTEAEFVTFTSDWMIVPVSQSSTITAIKNGAQITFKFYTVAGGSAGASVQPDWNQNDPTAPDYINNRICYADTQTIFDQDVTTIRHDADGNADDAGNYVTYLHDSCIIDIEYLESVDALTFTVDFNGKSYVYELGEDRVALGNAYIYLKQMGHDMGLTDEEIDQMIAEGDSFASLFKNTGESFCIMFDEQETMFITEEPGTYHITIGQGTVKKIDNCYIDWSNVNIPSTSIPSSLPEVTTEDNDKVLMVVDGVWKAGSITDGDEVAY